MRRILYSLLAVLVAMFLVALPVFAYLTNPTSMTIVDRMAFRNLAQNGDITIIFHYKIACTSYPTTPATSTILFRLYDIDGTTLKATSTPYMYSLFTTYGYGNGISGFYFPASSNLTWGASYKINIYGLPSYYTGLSPVTVDMTPLYWNMDNSTQEIQREKFYDYIIKLCDDFKPIYGSVPLKTTTDGEIALSIYGESYLTGAVPGIYKMCPQLFFSQVYVPTKMTTENYTMDLANKYKTRLQHTDIERGTNRVGALFGVSGEFLIGFVVIGLCVGACVYCMRKGWGLESGLTVATGIVICAAVLVGNVIFTMVMVGMLAAAIVLFWILYLKRAS
jgi:hypothetical protein